MPEARVVRSPYETAYLRKRMVDPRRVKQILLVATDNEPPIQGYATERVLPVSAWRASNKSCYDVLGDLTSVEASAHIGTGVGLEGLVELAMTVAGAIADRSPNKVRAYLQFKATNTYPPDRSGPRQYSLLTMAEGEAASTSEVLILGGDELVPQCDLTGAPLVEFQPEPVHEKPTDGDLQAHLARNQTMWETWCSLGVTERTCLRVDFQFRAKDKESADRLTDILQTRGFSVTTTSRRLLFLKKEWALTASEWAWWTLDRLQWKTIELHECAATLKVDLEGAGAMLRPRP